MKKPHAVRTNAYFLIDFFVFNLYWFSNTFNYLPKFVHLSSARPHNPTP